MEAEEQKQELVRFLARQADVVAIRDADPDDDGGMESNAWGRLADGLVGPRELQDLEDRLTNPHVRRRVSALMREWPESAEDTGSIATVRIVQEALRRRRWALAAAAGLLVAACVGIVAAVVWRGGEASPEVMLAEATRLVDADRHAEARRLLDQVLAREDVSVRLTREAKRTYGRSHDHRARALAKAGRREQAAAEADRAIHYGAKSVALFLIKAEAAVGGPVQVAEVTLDPVDPVVVKDVQTELPADVAALAKVYEEAKTTLYPNPFGFRELARLYLKHRQFALAAVNVQDWMRLAPEQAEALNLWGRVLYCQHQYASAVDVFKLALQRAESDEQKAVVHFNLACAYFDGEGDTLPKALAHYKRSVALAPKHPKAELARRRIKELEQGGVVPAPTLQ